MKRKIVIAILILATTGCASMAERIKEADITKYPDGDYTVTCVNGYCTSRLREERDDEN